MEYNMQRMVVPATSPPIQCDNLLLPPKKLTAFVKKNNRIMHATAKKSEVFPVSNGVDNRNVPSIV